MTIVRYALVLRRFGVRTCGWRPGAAPTAAGPRGLLYSETQKRHLARGRMALFAKGPGLPGPLLLLRHQNRNEAVPVNFLGGMKL
jgi:hypothetical protein